MKCIYDQRQSIHFDKSRGKTGEDGGKKKERGENSFSAQFCFDCYQQLGEGNILTSYLHLDLVFISLYLNFHIKCGSRIG